MSSLRITYLSDGWSLNTGNAFLDWGSIQSLRLAHPDATIHFTSVTPKWFFQVSKRNSANAFDLAQFIKTDYVVVSGMVLAAEFINFYSPTISKMLEKGAKLIINGGGGLRYTDKEIESVKRFLRSNTPYAFISRDEQSFTSFKDLARFSYNGIDCGFFISDYFVPPKLDLPDYIILNFDEHNLMRLIKSEVRAHGSKKNLWQQLANEKRLIISTHHIFWPKITIRIQDILENSKSKVRFARRLLPNVVNLNLPAEYFEQNTLISAFPEDYLSLYANTKITYSDRVHACVATMSFGNPAMLFSKTRRIHLFERIGAHTIGTEVTHPDVEIIRQEKLRQVKFLSEVLA